MQLLYRSLLFLVLLSAIPFVHGQSCALDPGWDTDGKLVSDGSRLGENIVVQADGKLLVGCNPFGDSYAYVKRFHPDGTLDVTYGTNGSFIVQVAERRTDIDGMVLHDGRLYICGSTTTDIGGTNTYPYAAAIEPDGGWVNSFATGGIKTFGSGLTNFYTATDIGFDANNKLYLTGLEWLDNLFVVRMNINGGLDNSWDGDGVAYINTANVNHWFEVNDIAFDNAGKILITGKKYSANNGSGITPFWNVVVARFNSNGSLDQSFATSGIGLYNSAPNDFDEGKRIQVDANNNYVVIGNTYDGVDYDYASLKLLNNGVLDPSFGAAGWSINDLQRDNEMEYCLNGALMSDGRILLTGNQGSGDTVHFALLMLLPDGSRDANFGPDGLFLNIFNQNNNSSSSGMALTPDGHIYLGGYTRTCANGTCGPLYMAVSRYVGGTPAVGLDHGLSGDLAFFPNPVTAGNLLHVQSIALADIQLLQLIDMSGRQFTLNPAVDGYLIPQLAKGTYLCRMRSVDGQFTSRIIVE